MNDIRKIAVKASVKADKHLKASVNYTLKSIIQNIDLIWHGLVGAAVFKITTHGKEQIHHCKRFLSH